MVQEEMRGAALRLEAKDVALDLQFEEALAREKQAHGFISEVGGRLKRAKEAMAAKDDLLHSISSKLHAAVASLRSHAEEVSELRKAADAASRTASTTASKLAALEERHMLVQADQAAAAEALDGYRDSLVQAEVQARFDRERMARLTNELQALQAEMAREAGGVGIVAKKAAADVPRPTGGVAESLPLPPLSSAVAGVDIAKSRVHVLYFLSSFLLLKTALSRTDNACAGRLRRDYPQRVPPTSGPHTSSHAFAQRTAQSALYDSEIDASRPPPSGRTSSSAQAQAGAAAGARGECGKGRPRMASPPHDAGALAARSPAGARQADQQARGGGPVIEMPVVEG